MSHWSSHIRLLNFWTYSFLSLNFYDPLVHDAISSFVSSSHPHPLVRWCVHIYGVNETTEAFTNGGDMNRDTYYYNRRFSLRVQNLKIAALYFTAPSLLSREGSNPWWQLPLSETFCRSEDLGHNAVAAVNSVEFVLGDSHILWFWDFCISITISLPRACDGYTTQRDLHVRSLTDTAT